jgi:pimeloyl-ACP methyl ester carboxylesterase
MIVSVFTFILVGVIVAGAMACFQSLPLIGAIMAVVVGAPFALWLGIVLYGLVRRAQPLRPFDEAEQKQSAARWGGEGRHITTPDGRIVEYLVYGSQRPDAKVIVQLHGTTSTGGFECRFNGPLLEELNLKGIAPSLPGHGYSDVHIGRQVADFPKDLEVILEAEAVDEFMVEGTSFGTSHSMATAWYFPPERCVAMGLNVPYLSDQICKEYKLESKADSLPRKDARNWYHAWNFWAADLMFLAPGLSPMGKFLTATPDGKRAGEERPWILELICDDQRERLVARGTQGQAFEQFSFDVTVVWGFDPREIQTRNIAVWYAMDDWACFPTHGEWVANYFGSKEGVKMNVRCEEKGLGHYTYMPSTGPKFTTSEQTMPQTLLDLCGE